MVNDDIDQLQSFGAKIIEKKQSISPSTKKTKAKNNRNKINVNIFYHIKIGINFFLKKMKHKIKKRMLKLHAYFSPYIIKVQTFDKRHHKSVKKQKFQQKHLIEKRKRIGNTIFIIRRMKKTPVKLIEDFPLDLQYVYYFHKKTQQKSNYQPKPSIWDVPIDDD